MKSIIKSILPRPLLVFMQQYKKRKLENSYKGNKVICVICNSKYKIFRPYGLVNRINAKCHNCGSLERHRLIYKYLKDKKVFEDSSKTLRVLHFAPEKVFYDFLKTKSHIQYTPCDLNPDIYNLEDVVKVDITSIPFEDNYFDFILCNHVLEHIPNDRLAMSELYRVMKKGGQGIFQVPLKKGLDKTYEDFSIVSPQEREIAFGQHDHVRWYGLDYKDRLEAAGFYVNLDDFINSFSSSDTFKFGLPEGELIYNCKK